MATIKYSKAHEWISVEGDIGTVGITNYAQEQLGDVVFVEMPDPGTQVEQDGDAGVVESVKAASEMYAPVSGEVTETNQALTDDPSLANSEAESGGWFFKVKLADPGQLDSLMDRVAYDAYVEGL